ncbi:MAG: hypothetical protein QXN37_01295 [Candidatus Anstonellaceae archaeon]
MKKKQKRKKLLKFKKNVKMLKVEPETFRPTKNLRNISMMEHPKENVYLLSKYSEINAKRTRIPHTLNALLAALATAILSGGIFLYILKMDLLEAVIYSLPIFLTVAILTYSYLERK